MKIAKTCVLIILVGLIIGLVLNTLALLITDYIVPGFMIDNWQTAVLMAIVLGIVNTFIKPILIFLTFPLTLLTLGLFIFVINAVILWMTSAVVPGVQLDGIWPAILGAIVLSVVSTALTILVKDIGAVKKH